MLCQLTPGYAITISYADTPAYEHYITLLMLRASSPDYATPPVAVTPLFLPLRCFSCRRSCHAATLRYFLISLSYAFTMMLPLRRFRFVSPRRHFACLPRRFHTPPPLPLFHDYA